jgi:hypothetical protein
MNSAKEMTLFGTSRASPELFDFWLHGVRRIVPTCVACASRLPVREILESITA